MATDAPSRSPTFRPDIEGLRGIAVLIVVAYHCRIPGFSGGFVGVDVFFVLSGYLITGLLVGEARTSRLHLTEFYARRVRRLLPAAALTALATLVIGAFVLAPRELAFTARAARATALYMSNVFFSLNAEDYFAPDVSLDPMVHTWSLAVEEQFYLFWPLLILLGLQVWRSGKVLVALLFGLTVASLGVCIWFTAHGGTFAFYQSPARAWEFGLGGLAAVLPRGRLAKLSSDWWLGLGWIGVLVILASGYAISANGGFPGWIALAPVLGTVAALVGVAESPHRGVAAFLESAPLQLVGRLSYSWYLWHWPFLALAAVLFRDLSTVGRACVALASLGVAAVTHRFVENPIRFHPYLVKRPVTTLWLGAALTAGSLSAAFLSLWFASRLAGSPEMKPFAAAAEDIAGLPRAKCVSLGDSPDVKTCTYGAVSSPLSIVLFGDSHAIQWFDPLHRLADAHGWALTTMVKSGCPTTNVTLPGSSASAVDGCDAWREEAIRRIVALRPLLVFIGNSNHYLIGSRKMTHGAGVSLDAWRDGTRKTLTRLTAAGLRVVAMRDTPVFDVDIPTCLARSLRNPWLPGGSCVTDKATSLNPAAFASELLGARDDPNVQFINLTDRLCRGDSCQTVEHGMIMYRDDNHLTGKFAEALAPELDAVLLPILGER